MSEPQKADIRRITTKRQKRWLVIAIALYVVFHLFIVSMAVGPFE
jgi:hypothetical protein